MDTITFFEIEQWEQEYLETQLKEFKVIFTNDKMQEVTNEDVYQSTIISPFIYSQVTKEQIDKYPNLALIATRSTGFDHIDIDYCKQKGIAVVHVPSYGSHTVAEHTFALILALSRKLIQTVERSKRGNFHIDGLKGFDLYGKTLGVVGEGEIGKKVVDIALSFGMNVLIYTRHPGSNRNGVAYTTLEDLMKQSDIISLHLPANTETHHLINIKNITLCKKGSILINTSRGQLVETQAIVEGLKTGIIKAAGLDVLEEEGALKEERELLTQDFLNKGDIAVQLLNHVLLTRDDVIFTNHNAFNSEEALKEILDVTIQNIHQYKQEIFSNSVFKNN